MRALMAGARRRPPTRPSSAAILQAAQERVAENFVNVFLFQLAKTGVADARLQGLWANSPTQANDMTGVAGRSDARSGVPGRSALGSAAKGGSGCCATP